MRRLRRVARKAPGLVMWLGQVQPVARMSASRASVICWAVQMFGSMPAGDQGVAELADMAVVQALAGRAASWAARRCKGRGRGVRPWLRGWGVVDGVFCGRVCALGE